MNLKEIRQSLYLTQEEFANYLGVSRQSLSAWEDGRWIISAKMYEKIRKKLKNLSKNA